MFFFKTCTGGMYVVIIDIIWGFKTINKRTPLADVYIIEATHSRLTGIIKQGKKKMLFYRENISRNSYAPLAKKKNTLMKKGLH